MTATQVDGVAVVASEPAESPLPRKEGSPPILFKRILRLLLEDGRTVFGCIECDYTAERAVQIRPHLGKHVDREAAASRAAVAAADDERDVLDMTIGEILGEVRRLDAIHEALREMTGSRNEWKDRAREAERKLASMKKALS